MENALRSVFAVVSLVTAGAALTLTNRNRQQLACVRAHVAAVAHRQSEQGTRQRPTAQPDELTTGAVQQLAGLGPLLAPVPAMSMMGEGVR